MGKIVDIPGSKARATIRARNKCQRGEGKGKAFLSPGTAATCEFAHPVSPSGTVARASWPPMFVELQCISKGPAQRPNFLVIEQPSFWKAVALLVTRILGPPRPSWWSSCSRRWHDVPPPTPPVEPSPKRFYFPQPISELQPKPGAQPAPNPQAQSQQEPGQPTVAGTQSGGQEN